MTGAQSGIVVYGDQRGAAYADYDGDGRLDLAVSQNGAATRLFHNRGAKPGLRVRVQGPPLNPDGVGAQLTRRLRRPHGARRARSKPGRATGRRTARCRCSASSGTPTAVWVRWPGGGEARVAVPAGAREVVVKR